MGKFKLITICLGTTPILKTCIFTVKDQLVETKRADCISDHVLRIDINHKNICCAGGVNRLIFLKVVFSRDTVTIICQEGHTAILLCTNIHYSWTYLKLKFNTVNSDEEKEPVGASI